MPRHYLHPSHPKAIRQDMIYWRRRQARLNPSDGGIVQQLKDFFINTAFNLRRKVRWPWLDSQSD